MSAAPTAPAARAALALALVTTLLCGTGCFTYRPVETNMIRGSEDIKGKVIRVRQGLYGQEMKVKSIEGPYVTGEVTRPDGSTIDVTMDLRTMSDMQIRQLTRGSKAAIITYASLLVAGGIVGAAAASLAKGGFLR
ncbi:MAG: hypothetical protein R3F14_21495 [Polyangiaceae bacterium]